MPTESESSSIIAQEIDDIIARAMAEYASTHPDEVSVTAAESVSASTISTNVVISEAVPVPDTPEEPEPEGSLLPWDEPEPAEPENTHQEIPENSSSLLVSEATSRFSSAIWFDNIQHKVVTIAGLGGIGSYVAFMIARVRPYQIILYDFDTVEAGNMSGQLYGYTHIGMLKSQAINQIIREYTDFYSTRVYTEPYTENSAVSEIMICGFDSMESRKMFFNSWKTAVHRMTRDNRKKYLFIDGRLAAESFQVFCFTGDDDYNIRKYEEEFLFSDEEADETICSYKQTTFMANMIGSIITNLFINFCANQCNPLIDRDLPFLTEYNAETMYFKVTA